MKTYALFPPPARTLADTDDGSMVLAQKMTWQEPVVQIGESVQKNTLLARGVTNIYYPANLWIFTLLVCIFGLATGSARAVITA
ncbi:MAG: hypothetical protein ACREU8_10600 [Gammaproteobacteria bacterium]